jgi:tetratricopeptide (TPR) repeat protein
MIRKPLLTAVRTAGVAVILASGGVMLSCGSASSDTLDEARLLRRSGNYSQALTLFQEVIAEGDSSADVLMEAADTAVLAAQTERTSMYRQKARESLALLTRGYGDTDPREVGELWRRLGWEMARNCDSLQSIECFDSALTLGLQDMFEEEWLLRGAFAAGHLELVAAIPDSIIGTPSADSILSVYAEKYLVELDRIPLARTDLRETLLRARLGLYPYTGRRTEELTALTELDRLGGIEPGDRLRRIQLLLDVASEDLAQNRIAMAREKLMEVWGSNFSGERVEAACMLGLMAEDAGDPADALEWYRRACAVAPGATTPASIMAQAKRDSLTYSGLE